MGSFSVPANRPKQANAGQFKPGQSGNPSGRPKDVGHVRDLARKHTTAAIKMLAAMMKSGEPDRTRVAAAEALLDRGWGKAPMYQELAVQIEPSEVSVMDICRRIAFLFAKAEQEKTNGND